MFRLIIFSIVLNVKNSLQNLIDCDQEITKTQLCKLGEVYPAPYHIIQPIINIFDVSEINEDKKTISVYFRLNLRWNDTYSKLKLANFDDFLDNGWYDITGDKNTAASILTTANFINSQSSEHSFNIFWHQEPHFKHFSENVKETFYCDLDFQLYPFDKHECFLKLYNIFSALKFLKFTPTEVYINSSSTNLTGPPLLISTHRLPFEITVESIPTGITFNGKWLYSTSGIVFNIRRNDIGQLIGGFFGPTAIFTLISLVSFFIDPDVVPGRMGLLLTVFLIITNSYNSIKAPVDRGFSFIEIWMIGIYYQILFAIIEYAYLMAKNRNKVMEMYPNVEQDRIKEQSKKLDQKAMIFSLIYFILFQCTYWSIVNSLE